jgi:hypothetical protein
MSRGWESKDVESQQAERESAAKQLPERSLAEQAALREKENLLLSRTRLQQELQTACHPRRRGQLEAALTHIEAELARLA